MPLCRFTYRTPLHNYYRSSAPNWHVQRTSWLSTVRRYGDTSEGDRRDEGPGLKDRSADSSYLDLILGPPGSPSGPPVKISDKAIRRARKRSSTIEPSFHAGQDNINEFLQPSSLYQETDGHNADITSGASASQLAKTATYAPLISTKARHRVEASHAKPTHGTPGFQEVLIGNKGRAPPTKAKTRVKRDVSRADLSQSIHAGTSGDELGNREDRNVHAQKPAFRRLNLPHKTAPLDYAVKKRLSGKRPRGSSVTTRRLRRHFLAYRGRKYRAGKPSIRSSLVVRKPADLLRLRRNYKHLTARLRRVMVHWHGQYELLARTYDKRHPAYGTTPCPPRISKNAEKRAIAVLPSLKLRFVVRTNLWHSSHHLWDWHQILLWLLYNHPVQAIAFLRNSSVLPHKPRRMVEDALQYLASHFSHLPNAAGSKARNLRLLAHSFAPIAKGFRRGKGLFIRSSLFRLMIPHCSNQQVGTLYKAIKTNLARAMPWALLHFCTYFARHGRFEKALDALSEAKNASALWTINSLRFKTGFLPLALAFPNSHAFRSNCATLLRLAIRQPAGLRMCLRIVDDMVQYGVTLNAQLRNIVILNAVEAGDFNTAFAVYVSLKEHGLQADQYTYAALLKGCKAAIDDAQRLNTTIQDAIEYLDVQSEPVVATEILHCLALHHTKHHPETAFETVADAYAQFFDLEPLRQLGMTLPKLSQRSHPEKQRMLPRVQALNIILATYLEHLFVHHKNTDSALELYRRFRVLVDEGIEPFISLTTTDYLANTFLMAFTKTRRGLVSAAEVIKDMQRPTNPDVSMKRCPPTVQTWTIFLNGFLRHRQTQLAEQVLEYMQDKGMRPNQVTWNVLIAGYAGAQDLEGLLDVLRRMEVDGAVWDRWTEGGLRRVRDQYKLQRRLRERKTDIDFTADLKENLGDRIKLFSPEAEAQKKAEDAAETRVETADSPGELAEMIKYNPPIY